MLIAALPALTAWVNATVLPVLPAGAYISRVSRIRCITTPSLVLDENQRPLPVRVFLGRQRGGEEEGSWAAKPR